MGKAQREMLKGDSPKNETEEDKKDGKDTRKESSSSSSSSKRTDRQPQKQRQQQQQQSIHWSRLLLFVTCLGIIVYGMYSIHLILDDVLGGEIVDSVNHGGVKTTLRTKQRSASKAEIRRNLEIALQKERDLFFARKLEKRQRRAQQAQEAEMKKPEEIAAASTTASNMKQDEHQETIAHETESTADDMKSAGDQEDRAPIPNDDLTDPATNGNNTLRNDNNIEHDTQVKDGATNDEAEYNDESHGTDQKEINVGSVSSSSADTTAGDEL